MSNSKAVCCTFLFTVVILSLWISTFFIKDAWQPVSCTMSGILMGRWTIDFYKWLTKEDKK